jgi:hypothetical protein
MPRTDIQSFGVTDVAVASAARTTSSDSGAIPGLGYSKTLRAQLNVTAASGTTPTLDVLIEDTLDDTTWNTVGTFVQKITTGREVINVTIPYTATLRVRWTVGGTTPSFTFAVHIYSE